MFQSKFLVLTPEIEKAEISVYGIILINFESQTLQLLYELILKNRQSSNKSKLSKVLPTRFWPWKSFTSQTQNIEKEKKNNAKFGFSYELDRILSKLSLFLKEMRIMLKIMGQLLCRQSFQKCCFYVKVQCQQHIPSTKKLIKLIETVDQYAVGHTTVLIMINF